MNYKVYNYRIYRNLHKGCWSIQHRTPGGWRLYEHLDSLEATGCTTRVYETGRQRVLLTKKKNVHAFILCESYTAHGDCVMIPGGRLLRYNPYKYPNFYIWDVGYDVEIDSGKIFGKATLLADGEVIINDLQS